ncbi:MAG: hypothetical protein A2431_02520 [Candidatus Zambryskibacteria bacterium RIFOXYC1_FULL_39_10]|uniref:Uncharacterized protein n=1 Tax=Candidatus Zambryskibacteria bacterium RIFOXYC1_FULL_39_10 TaxID=1802779 RepID=A0A1G2V1T7_9BACT|nr:MAG: hypothetical protein A2431_02520 [Candidatus Zambryskibacteria bacterium RIFOXYC1_FULL_39_10]
MHTSLTGSLPDAFRTEVEARRQLSHQPVVVSAESGIQLPMFDEESNGQLPLPLPSDNEE